MKTWAFEPDRDLGRSSWTLWRHPVGHQRPAAPWNNSSSFIHLCQKKQPRLASAKTLMSRFWERATFIALPRNLSEPNNGSFCRPINFFVLLVLVEVEVEVARKYNQPRRLFRDPFILRSFWDLSESLNYGTILRKKTFQRMTWDQVMKPPGRKVWNEPWLQIPLRFFMHLLITARFLLTGLLAAHFSPD